MNSLSGSDIVQLERCLSLLRDLSNYLYRSGQREQARECVLLWEAANAVDSAIAEWKKGDSKRASRNPTPGLSTSAWRKDSPPRDGSVFVAVGRICWNDGDAFGVERFCGPIAWNAETKSWWNPLNGLDCRLRESDVVQIDSWIVFPEGGGK